MQFLANRWLRRSLFVRGEGVQETISQEKNTKNLQTGQRHRTDINTIGGYSTYGR